MLQMLGAQPAAGAAQGAAPEPGRPPGAHGALDGPDGDPWARWQASQVSTRWVPPHLTASDAAAGGSSVDDWAGNACADLGAKEAVKSRSPGKHIVEARRAEIEALRVVHQVIACAQQKHIERTRNQGIRRKPARRRAKRTFGAKRQKLGSVWMW